MISINDQNNKLYIPQYPIGLSHNKCGPHGPKWGWGGPSGCKIGLVSPKNGSNFGFKLKSKKYPHVEPTFGSGLGPQGPKGPKSGSFRIKLALRLRNLSDFSVSSFLSHTYSMNND